MPRLPPVAIASVLALCLASSGGAARAGNALHFDGTDDVVTIADSPSLDLAADFTLEAWVDLPPAQDFAVYSSGIVSKTSDQFDAHQNYYLALRNETNAAMFIIGDGTDFQALIGRQSLPAGVWVHVAAVRSADSLALFVNGVRDTSVARRIAQAANSGPVRFGGIPSPLGPRLFLDAVVDEVRIWNVARSDTSIQNEYACELPPDSPGLVGYWKLDASSGQIVADASPSANHGTRGGSAAAGADDPAIVASSAPVIPCATDVPASMPGRGAAQAARFVAIAPNPATERCTLSFDLARPGIARLAVFDVRGRELRVLYDRRSPPGRHSLEWDCRDAGTAPIAAGLYFAVLYAADGTDMRKILIER